MYVRLPVMELHETVTGELTEACVLHRLLWLTSLFSVTESFRIFTLISRSIQNAL